MTRHTTDPAPRGPIQGDWPADNSTSTAPLSRNSSPGLPWGTQGCTEEHRRGLATDGGVHMIGISEAERTAEGHRDLPDDELCK